MSLDLEYQVIEGGDLDIDFEAYDPDGKRIFNDEKSTDESHELTVTQSGVYSFCIDNSFSSITRKLVYLDLGISRDDIDVGNNNENEGGKHIETVFNIYGNIEGIRGKLEKANSYQGALRANEARQRYFLEANYSRVLWVSSVASIIMIGVGLVQVYFVRSLFDQRHKSRI